MTGLDQVLKVFIDIAMLRRSPEDLPASRALFTRALAVYAFAGMLLFQMQVTEPQEAVLELAVVLAIELGYFLVLLQVLGKGQRVLQTLTAIAGTGALLTTLGLPLHYCIQTAPQGASASDIPKVGVLLLLLWSFLVGGHIVSKALEIPLIAGIVLVVGEFILAVSVTARLFGGAA